MTFLRPFFVFRHLAFNNLPVITRADGLMDHATTGAQSIAESGIVHLHVLHGDDLFSKSQYEAGNYSQLDIAGTATSTSFWPIFHAFLSFIPPHMRRST